jgi:L-lactate dehydrogenase complex protein LldG
VICLFWRRVHLEINGGTLADKQEVLARIRRALGTAPSAGGTSAGSRSAATLLASQVSSNESREERFCSEFEKVGGHVFRIESVNQIDDYLDSLLPSERPISVAVSDGLASRLPGLRTWLAGRGATLLDSLGEFAAARAGDEASLMEDYKRDLFNVAMGLTTADYAIADTGTLVLLSHQKTRSGSAARAIEQHRLISLVPPVHVCLLDSSRIVPDLTTLMSRVGSLYQDGPRPLAMTFITGPSRTADIELTLTMGVHGPREVHLLVLAGSPEPRPG